jgi:hypothetical protein
MAAAAIPGILTARRHAARHKPHQDRPEPETRRRTITIGRRNQASIGLLGPWRAKEIAEFVHQPAEIRARDRYLARLARDRAGRDESGVLPIAAHHRRAELNLRMLALELVKSRDGAPPWRQSARDGL